MGRWEKLKIDLRLSNTHIKQARSGILYKTQHENVLIFSQELTSSQDFTITINIEQEKKKTDIIIEIFEETNYLKLKMILCSNNEI